MVLDSYVAISAVCVFGCGAAIEIAEMMGFRDEVKVWRKHFTSADADSSGYVDLAELTAVLGKAGAVDAGEEATALFKLGGKDPSGSLNFDEFVALAIFKSPLKRSLPVITPLVLEDSMKTKLRDLFQKNDVGGKGHLTEEELCAVMRQELNYEQPEKELADVLKTAETKSRSKVTFEEFPEVMRLSIQMQKYREAFRESDKYQSGKISTEEVTVLLAGLGAKSPKREARRLMKTKEGKRRKGLTADKFVELVLRHRLTF